MYWFAKSNGISSSKALNSETDNSVLRKTDCTSLWLLVQIYNFDEI